MMVEAKLLRKKLKNGLIVDKWDLVNIIEKQADRIAELEECIEACYAVQKMQAEEVYKGNDRIAELEKTLQDGIKTFGELQFQLAKDKFETPQTRQLSDEEIKSLYECCWIEDVNGEEFDFNMFARAIEAKVREE